jgi:hypothetical protein
MHALLAPGIKLTVRFSSDLVHLSQQPFGIGIKAISRQQAGLVEILEARRSPHKPRPATAPGTQRPLSLLVSS